MARKVQLFDKVLEGANAAARALPPTDAYGNRRVAELAAAEQTAMDKAKLEHRVIALVDPREISVASDLRDRDMDAARRDTDYAELLADIRAHGIREPLGVRLKRSGGLELVKGLRRLTAALELELPTVPVIEGTYESDDSVIEEMLRENLLRQDPPAMEVAFLFARLRNEHKWEEERVAALLRAKGGALSRLRTVSRAFMPWLPAAYPAYRDLPIMEMARIAGLVEQSADRRPTMIEALGDLAGQTPSPEGRAVVDAIRTVAQTGIWKGVAPAPEPSAAETSQPRSVSRAAYDTKGSKAALLTQHEGQQVIRFVKKVPDYVIDRAWDTIQEMIKDIDISE